MGLVTKMGRWLDKRFPEKMELEDVLERFSIYEKDLGLIHTTLETLDIRLTNKHDLSIEVEKLKADVQKLQALSVVKVRPPYQGNMNAPFMPGPVSK